MPVVAVGAVGAVLAALMAVLIAYGATLLGRWIASLVPDWHIPGLGSIRGFVSGAIGQALSVMNSALQAAAGPVANWLLAVPVALHYLIDEAIHGLQSAWNTANALMHLAQYLYNLARAEIGSAFNRLRSEVGWVYNTLAAAIASTYLKAQHYAQHIYNLGLIALGAAYNALRSEIGAVYARVLRDIDAAYWEGVHYAQYVYNLARADAAKFSAAAEANAKAYAKAYAASLSGILATDIVTPVEHAWVDIRDVVTELEGVIASDLPDIGAAVRAIPRAVPAEVAAAIGAGVAIDQVLLRYLRDCGIPNCRNLGGLGRDLKDLLGLVEGAGLLAFLELMIRDPERAVSETITTLDGVVHSTVTTFTDLVGVG